MFYLADPPVGTLKIKLNLANCNKIMAAVMTLYGIDQ
jgi:hypothetical protein